MSTERSLRDRIRNPRIHWRHLGEWRGYHYCVQWDWKQWQVGVYGLSCFNLGPLMIHRYEELFVD